MRLLITLVVVAVLSWALARPLCSHSMLFDLAAVALAGAGAYLTIAPPAVLPRREVAFVVQKGYVAFALFAVVMMMGVLDKRSAVRRRLQPVRAQLSLLGTILIAGHIGFYAVVYLEILGSVGASNPFAVAGFTSAVALVVLLVPLAVTSIDVVRRRLGAMPWKRLQRLAYPFFALILVHAGCYLAKPVLGGSADASLNLAVYALLLATYGVLRVRRALADRRASEPAASEDSTSGAEPLLESEYAAIA